MINRNVLLWSLEELASKSEQERLWDGPSDSKEISSFTEAVCGVFDDAGITRALEKGYLKSHFSSDLCQKVQELDALISHVPHYGVAPREVIEHPGMTKIRKVASELLLLFRTELKDDPTSNNAS
jgi:hypothetical protein